MLTGGSFLSGALTGAAGSAMGSLTGLIPGIQTNGWGTAVQVGSSAPTTGYYLHRFHAARGDYRGQYRPRSL
jgi:hypothetical protein